MFFFLQKIQKASSGKFLNRREMQNRIFVDHSSDVSFCQNTEPGDAPVKISLALAQLC